MSVSISSAAIIAWLITFIYASPLSQLDRRDIPNINNWDYFGCFREADWTRALTASAFDSTTLTVEACAAFYDGYAYFGVEYGIEVRDLALCD